MGCTWRLQKTTSLQGQWEGGNVCASPSGCLRVRQVTLGQVLSFSPWKVELMNPPSQGACEGHRRGCGKL